MLSAIFDPFDKVERFPSLWRISRLDILPLTLIALLPLLVALPKLLGWLRADPMLYFGSMASSYVGAALPGVPYLDPNDGWTAQALGYRAALDWVHGEVPWWNPYSGVGLPLAAEYQPAAFFPLTLILLLPQGVVWRHLLLQGLAGWGTYGLLRQLGLGRTAALTGGLLYGFNGTLAWFGDAPAFPVPFLPWMLWGVERAYSKTALGQRGGWRLLAISLVMNLLAGFPETAYINGLLVAVWSVLRWTHADPAKRLSYSGRIATACAIGIGICAPQILAFLELLPLANVGGHGGGIFNTLPSWATLAILVEPYAYWPLYAVPVQGLDLGTVFSQLGGYVTLGIVLLAVYESVRRPNALNLLLLTWIGLALARIFGIEPVASIWNFIPGVVNAAFFRYSAPSWELAIIILAARCVDGLDFHRMDRKALLATIVVLVIATDASAWVYGEYLRPNLIGLVGRQHFAAASVAWTTLTGLACTAMILTRPSRWRQFAVAILIVVDGIAMYAVPTLSNPRDGEVDVAAIRFLRDGLGFQRFYTLGPIQPNYSAYFGIGSINEIYAPIPQNWVDWVETRLDRYSHGAQFSGDGPRRAGGATAAEELRENTGSFEAVGVKYVIAPPSLGNPFIEHISSETSSGGNQPLQLQPGQKATGMLPATLFKQSLTITGVGVALGNYGNLSDGILSVVACTEIACATGTRNLKESHNNVAFDVTLGEPLHVPSNTSVRYTITHEGGKSAVALWAFPTGENQSQNLHGPAGALEGFGLQVRLQISSAMEIPKEVYTDEIMDIYELRDFKPYFEAIGGPCVLQATERTRILADCRAPASLIRRELYFSGWTAEVNGKEGEISEYDGIFQEIALPAGKSDVRYHYAPPHIAWAWLVTLLAIVILCREGLLWMVSMSAPQRAMAG